MVGVPGGSASSGTPEDVRGADSSAAGESGDGEGDGDGDAITPPASNSARPPVSIRSSSARGRLSIPRPGQSKRTEGTPRGGGTGPTVERGPGIPGVRGAAQDGRGVEDTPPPPRPAPTPPPP